MGAGASSVRGELSDGELAEQLARAMAAACGDDSARRDRIIELAKTRQTQHTSAVDSVATTTKEALLAVHNELRERHGAGALQWCDECSRTAALAAEACQAKGEMFHNNHTEFGFGQNIYWSSSAAEISAAVKAWYGEVENPGYDFAAAEFSSGTGHFTQLVWRGTVKVGVGLSSDGRFLVCNYSPQGNVIGQFLENVLPCPGGRGAPPESAAAVAAAIAGEQPDAAVAAGVVVVVAAAAAVDGGSGQRAIDDDMKAALSRFPSGHFDELKETAVEALHDCTKTVTMSFNGDSGGGQSTMEVKIEGSEGSQTMTASWGTS